MGAPLYPPSNGSWVDPLCHKKTYLPKHGSPAKAYIGTAMALGTSSGRIGTTTAHHDTQKPCRRVLLSFCVTIHVSQYQHVFPTSLSPNQLTSGCGPFDPRQPHQQPRAAFHVTTNTRHVQSHARVSRGGNLQHTVSYCPSALPRSTYPAPAVKPPPSHCACKCPASTAKYWPPPLITDRH